MLFVYLFDFYFLLSFFVMRKMSQRANCWSSFDYNKQRQMRLESCRAWKDSSQTFTHSRTPIAMSSQTKPFCRICFVALQFVLSFGSTVNHADNFHCRLRLIVDIELTKSGLDVKKIEYKIQICIFWIYSGFLKRLENDFSKESYSNELWTEITS